MQPKDLNITVDNGIKTLEVLTGAALEPTLVSPEANDMTEQTKDGAIDTVIEGICKIAPDIAILEI